MKTNLVATLLLVISIVGIGMARLLYPAANEFSIFTTTISFLGSPDTSRNPQGFLWYQAGMTALIILLILFVGMRHKNLRPYTGAILQLPTALYYIAMTLILVSVWIPDSREIYWGSIRTGHLHTRIAIVAILIVMLAVAGDGLVLRSNQYRGNSIWIIRCYMSLWLVGIVSLSSWEWKCRRNPQLEHWPGEGIHSTPFWEWILFLYLIFFLYWFSRRGTAQGAFATEFSKDRD